MAKSGTAAQDLFFTIPEPRRTQMCGGMTDLSEDVRLVTSNVAPLYRKTMRTVLASAGIRVVANKKKFIIDVRVESIDALTLKDVPPEARDEYYEIDLIENAVTVRTASQIGALWGTHTLAGIYRAKARGLPIPNMKLRDWPDCRLRGAFIKSLWGLDRLAPEEWMNCFERLAAVKLNLIGIPFDGGWAPAARETASAGLLTPLPELPQLAQPVHLAWYSPNLKTWRAELAPAKLHTENYLAQVLSMARETGLTGYPVVSGLGERTALPRLLPAISARNAAGEPTGAAFCLSAPETRQALESVYGAILQTYFAEGTPFFMVHLGPTGCDAKGRPSLAACECAKCKKKTPAQLVQEHLLWLVPLLTARRAKSVILCDDLDAASSAAVFTADFARQLEKAKLVDRIVFTRRQADAAKAKGGAVLPAKARGWVMPDLPGAIWTRTEDWQKLLPKLIPQGLKDGREGVLFETVWDTPCLEVIENVANLSWAARGPLPPVRPLKDVLSLHLGKDTHVLTDIITEFGKTMLSTTPVIELLRLPALAALLAFRTDGSYDLRPGLERLVALDPKKVHKTLQETTVATRRTAQKLNALLDREEKPADVEMVRSLLCEALRVTALAQGFDSLLEIWEAVGRRKVDAKARQACDLIRTTIIDASTIIENRRTKLTSPLKLSELAPLLGLAEQLATELPEVISGKRKPDALQWTWKPVPPTP